MAVTREEGTVRGYLPWWAKIGAKLILSRLPFGYTVWSRLGLFRHGAMDMNDYAIRIVHSHAEKAGLIERLHGKTVLELGPGDSVASAVIAAAHGARAILVDAGAFVRKGIASYLELSQILTEQGLFPPDLSGCQNVRDILNCCGAQYQTEGLTSLRQIDAESVDLIFSQAVLEHVRKGEFLETMHECRRILRRGGICSHQIDLRDHLAGALNNLRFSDQVWESDFFAKSGFYTNRIQYNQMLKLFDKVGFSVTVSGIRKWDTLPTPRKGLAEQFRGGATEELLISGFDVLLY